MSASGNFFFLNNFINASEMYVGGKNLSLAGRLGECKGSTRVDRISGDVVLKYDGNGNPIKYILKNSQGEIIKRDLEEGHLLPIII